MTNNNKQKQNDIWHFSLSMQDFSVSHMYQSYKLQISGRMHVGVHVGIQVYSGEAGGCPRGIMVKAMDCKIVVCEFVLQSRYYVHFRANTLGKGMNPLIRPAMG